MIISAATMAACLALLCSTPGAQERMPLGEYLVGAYYFAGWWAEQPNKWTTDGIQWGAGFPDRLPLLGQYNSQQTMDREILSAAKHDVDFFQILWYPPLEARPGDPHNRHLNDGVRFFAASPYRSRMSFSIEYVNHEPFDIRSEEDWRNACRLWAGYMAMPCYLRVGGRPVFKIHGLEHFIRQCAGDPARVAARLRVLRQTAKEVAGADPLLSAGVMAGSIPLAESAQGFDFLTTYMDVPPLPVRPELYSYALLAGQAEAAWSAYAEASPLPYVPYVPSGWDPRPWKDPRPSFAAPTREEWTDVLQRVRSRLDREPRLGITLPDGTRCKMLLIYAWNEYGEGGVVAPTRLRGTQRLEAIRAVFRHDPVSSKHH